MIKRILAGIMVIAVLMNGSLAVNAQEPRTELETEETQIPEKGETVLTEEPVLEKRS
ncbi:MAG: hypothetical protein HFI23_02405 [Lachnospiraceae bacterium]|nr:hypothetical protein [Lachnospiraceae bacterium]